MGTRINEPLVAERKSSENVKRLLDQHLLTPRCVTCRLEFEKALKAHQEKYA